MGCYVARFCWDGVFRSTFYLGGKDVKRTGPFRDKDYDKDDEEAEAELGVVTAQEVQPLEEMLEETAGDVARAQLLRTGAPQLCWKTSPRVSTIQSGIAGQC